ncbi:MAG: HetP family heterocyst commitment protein [Mastigocoleus sp.]
MNQDISGLSRNLEKTLNPEQFDQVVEAILSGKYSWACVLILRFAGYNPLHYIPYRTYNRLLKENSSTAKNQSDSSENFRAKKSLSHKRSKNLAPSCLNKIKDLAYLEVAGKQKTEIRGGKFDKWLDTQVQEYQSVKEELEIEAYQNS